MALEINSKQMSEWYLNTIIDVDQWLSLGGPDGSGGPSSDDDIRCNVIINGGTGSISPGSNTQIDNNVFFNTTSFSTAGSATTNLVFANASQAQAVDYCFYRKLRTGPERVCIPNAKPQTTSPHYRACDTSTGTRKGIGINDDLPF
jgi:hypothetical protein